MLVGEKTSDLMADIVSTSATCEKCAEPPSLLSVTARVKDEQKATCHQK